MHQICCGYLYEVGNPPARLAVLFWLTVVFTLVMALVPKPPAALLVAGDKILHMAASAVLSALAFLAFPRRRVIELFAALAELGALIEILQMIPVPHREDMRISPIKMLSGL